jgi:hypothetical protein
LRGLHIFSTAPVPPPVEKQSANLSSYLACPEPK